MSGQYLVYLQIDDDIHVKEAWFDSRSEARDNYDALRAMLDYLEENGVLDVWTGGENHAIYLLLVKVVGDIPEEWPILSLQEYHV